MRSPLWYRKGRRYLALPGQDGTDYSMRILTLMVLSQKCGNGIRCLARFVAELSGSSKPNG